MKDKITMAISKAISTSLARDARKGLDPGRHEVNCTVRLNGELVVSESQKITATATLMSVDFLLLALKSAGVTREAAMNAIESVAGQYLVDWTGSKEDKRAAKAARKAAIAEYDPEGKGSQVFDDFKSKLPKVPRAGAVKYEGTVEQVVLSDGVLVEAADEA